LEGTSKPPGFKQSSYQVGLNLVIDHMEDDPLFSFGFSHQKDYPLTV
jgi:hypothetical protein